MTETHTTTEVGYAEAPHEGAHGSTPLLQDTATWVLIPVLIVVALFIWKGVPGLLARALDDRGKKIADELEQARALREEAQEVLASYKRRQREAEEEAEAVVEMAKEDAKRMAQEARVKIEEQLARRTAAAEAKIARAEEQAIAEVRNQTADLSAKAAETIIRSRTQGNAGSALLDKAIEDVRSKLN